MLDAVTIKEDIMLSLSFYDEVISTARDAGVETMFCPYLCCTFDSSPTWPAQIQTVLHDAIEAGADGFVFYEAAAFINGNDEGGVTLLYTELENIISALKLLY